MTFKKKIIAFFEENGIGWDSLQFFTFVVVLKCVNYKLTKDTAYKICRFSPNNYKDYHFKILTEQKDLNLLKAHFTKIRATDLFLMFLNLEIKLSNKICLEVSKYIDKKQYKIYYELFEVYVDLLKSNKLNNILKDIGNEKIAFFVKQREFAISKKKQTLLDLQVKKNKIGNFKPYYTNSSQIWNDSLPPYFKPIPLGGLNKFKK